jgi:hypothetical protein
MLLPYPSEGMTCWPISTRVGNVKNNDPSLIEPVAASQHPCPVRGGECLVLIDPH